MQGHIHNGIVNKPGPIPDFFRYVPELSPHGVFAAKAHVHDYVEGRRAGEEDVGEIIKAANGFWRKTTGEVTTGKYMEYVNTRAVGTAGEELARYVTELMPKTLPRCFMVHGDMTLENIIMTPSPVFIDPGKPIILTPALDRGKLLQSIVMKWETKGWRQPGEMPEWATTTDLLFLITHWIRLQRHQVATESGFDVLASLLEKQLSST